MLDENQLLEDELLFVSDEDFPGDLLEIRFIRLIINYAHVPIKPEYILY